MCEKLLPVLAGLLPRQTAIIGGGGKSTLMLGLGSLLAEQGHSVLLTTTTHVAWPPPACVGYIAPASIEELNGAAHPGTVVLAGYPEKNGRMTGISAEFLAAAAYDFILIEADGSRRFPLKVHKEGEPVIPEGTGLVLQVAGLSAVGMPAEEAVHRCSILGLSARETVTAELAARILLRGAGFCGGLPHIDILNQADCPQGRKYAERVCRLLTEAGERCLYGSLREEGAPCWC